jgi:hypothetical protein
MPITKSLADLTADQVIASILDPEGSPLPAEYEQEKRRVIQAARLWDTYPNERRVAAMIQAKYNVSLRTALRDVDLARQVFKTQHTFDYEAMSSWMVKDQIDLIQKCKLKGDLKEWNKAKKVLQDMVEKMHPTYEEDPQRMQANLFVINVTAHGQQFQLPLEKVRALDPESLKTLVDSLSQPIEDAEILDEIFDS